MGVSLRPENNGLRGVVQRSDSALEGPFRASFDTSQQRYVVSVAERPSLSGRVASCNRSLALKATNLPRGQRFSSRHR